MKELKGTGGKLLLNVIADLTESGQFEGLNDEEKLEMAVTMTEKMMDNEWMEPVS